LVIGGAIGLLASFFLGKNENQTYQAEYNLNEIRAYFKNSPASGSQTQRNNEQGPGGTMPPDDEDDKEEKILIEQSVNTKILPKGEALLRAYPKI